MIRVINAFALYGSEIPLYIAGTGSRGAAGVRFGFVPDEP